MASGVKVNPECLSEYECIKMGRKYDWITYKLSENYKEIIVDKIGEKGSGYDGLKARLIEAAGAGECRYAVYDLDYKFKGEEKNKLLFIAWSPESAKIKQKMTATSSKAYLKNQLKLEVEVQATDEEEMSLEAFVERASRTNK